MPIDIDSVKKRADNLSRRISAGTILALYGAAVVVFIVTGFRGHPYSTGGLSQHRFLAFSQSLQHFMAAQAAFLCYWIARYHRRCVTGDVRRPWLWLALSLAFIVAMYDKQLEVHEKLLPVLQRTFPWLSFANDILITFYGVGAIIFTLFFFRELRSVPKTVYFYAAALFLFLLSAVVDYMQAGWPIGTRAFVISSIVEELSQYIAGATFALAFLFYALDKSRLALVNWLSSSEMDEYGRAAEPLVKASNEE